MLHTLAAIKNKFAPIALGITSAILLLAPASAQAAFSSSISLGATPNTVTVNANTAVSVYINTGSGQSDGAEVVVTYDAAKLKYVSIDYSGSPFNNDSPNFSASSGRIVISRYTGTPPGPSGSFLLARITFNALASSGTSTVGVDQAASYVSDHNAASPTEVSVTPASVSGTTLSFQPVPPPAVAPVTPTVTPTTPTKSQTTATPTKAPARTTVAPTTTEAPTTEVIATPLSTPDGTPVASIPVITKSYKSLYIIGGSTFAAVLMFAAATTMMRKRALGGVVGGSSHSIISQPIEKPIPADAPINKIPTATLNNPGDVIQPNDPNSHTPSL